MVGGAEAFDIFTLWRQPLVPLRLAVGEWADYRTVTWISGRRSEDLLRIQCVGRSDAPDQPSWIIEMLPLTEDEAGFSITKGEGLLLQLSGRLLDREGQLTDLVERIVRWEAGQPTELSPEEWREDPLVTASLTAEFMPDRAESVGVATRVVAGRELRCTQFEMTAADTERVTLPRGELQQVSVWEVTAEVNGLVPFLGIAYAAERTKSHSRLDPPSKRFPLPAPVTEVETMELIDFGDQARPALLDH
jgi:hypothetical protein